MKTSIVTTTINLPVFLKNIITNSIKYSNTNINYNIIVIGDYKTPIETESYCKKLSKDNSVDIKYYNVDGQKKALEKNQKLLDLIPFNDGARKMIGTYMAYFEGCDNVIMVDDDNFCTDSSFIEFHSIVGQKIEIDLIKSHSGWFNICKSMIERNNIPFYPRGYPWSQRFNDHNDKFNNPEKIKKNIKVVVNLGLILGDPDIDAVSRLFWPIDVVAINNDYEKNFALYPGTWSPFNDQNTSIYKDIIPVYFKPPSTGRNADIWTSYLISKLTEHMGAVISYGEPLVRQIRNLHDLKEDYKLEEKTNRATQRFINLLRKVKLTKDNYVDCLSELIYQCLNQLSQEEKILSNSIESNKSVHHQLPKKEVLIRRENEDIELITNFFKEYEIWNKMFVKQINLSS